MSSLKNVWIAMAVVTVIAVGGYFSPKVVSVLGSGTRFPNGLSADSTSPVAGEVRGTTLTTTGAGTFGGNVTVTTGASATSTLSAGCINTYATSSATQIKLVFNTSATTTSINGGTVQGVVAWQYGSCPI